jgi:hypothetical protein
MLSENTWQIVIHSPKYNGPSGPKGKSKIYF